MDCNKEEATRSMLIAESKLEQNDFVGAKKFAQKAQSLYPGLHGINQLLTTLDVFLAGQNKICGEIYWYGVLGLKPSADDDTIKRHYRHLALMLHPDKNMSAGADAGFKLISEAKIMLLDKEKRAAYDERLGFKGLELRPPTHTAAPSAAPHNYNVSQSEPPRADRQKAPSAPRRRSQKKVPGDGQARQYRARVLHDGGPSMPPEPSQPEFSAYPTGFSFASRKTWIPKTQTRREKAPSSSNPAPAPPHQTGATFWTVCVKCGTHYEYLKRFRSHTLKCRTCVKPFVAEEVAAPENLPKTAKRVPGRPQKRSAENIPAQNADDPQERPDHTAQQAHDSSKRSRTSAGPRRSRKGKQEHGSDNGFLTPLETQKLLILKGRKEILKRLNGFRL